MTSSAEPGARAGEGLRVERDALGELALPAGALSGIHTARAVASFPLAGRPVHPALVRAYGDVKLACAPRQPRARVHRRPARPTPSSGPAGRWREGLLTEHVVVDALQGGAGTSTNMNVNEVLANRALVLMGERPGRYDLVSPLDDVNLHQSTNDTYPTALRVAAIRLLRAPRGRASSACRRLSRQRSASWHTS